MVIIDSVSFYRPFWLCMRILAPSFFHKATPLVRAYEVVLHALVTLWFPLHLLLHLLLHPSPADLFKNLTMSLTCVACSLKNVAQLYRLPEMVEIESLIGQLDKCIEGEQEHRYYQDHLLRQVRRFTRCLYLSYVVIYLLFIFGAIAQLFEEGRELLWPAYFPFDWDKNGYLYGVTFSYQLITIVLEGIQGLTNDTYSTLTLCLLGGHLHLWSIRMSRLGLEEEPEDQHLRLLEYIEQHKLLMRGVLVTSYLNFFNKNIFCTLQTPPPDPPDHQCDTAGPAGRLRRHPVHHRLLRSVLCGRRHYPGLQPGPLRCGLRAALPQLLLCQRGFRGGAAPALCDLLQPLVRSLQELSWRPDHLHPTDVGATGDAGRRPHRAQFKCLFRHSEDGLLPVRRRGADEGQPEAG